MLTVASLSRGRARINLLVAAYDLGRETRVESISWSPQAAPLARRNYTFDTCPHELWSSFKARKEHIRRWRLSLGFVEDEAIALEHESKLAKAIVSSSTNPNEKRQCLICSFLTLKLDQSSCGHASNA